jgi:hypothetical protein
MTQVDGERIRPTCLQILWNGDRTTTREPGQRTADAEALDQLLGHLVKLGIPEALGTEDLARLKYGN